MKGIELVKLIDTSLCTACRGCQVACKQWNELPAFRTKNSGSYQNPPDLQWNTWTLIRFQEHEDVRGKFRWLFRKDGCMHCTDAACVKVCPSGALHYTPYGTVAVDNARCIGCKECVSACPTGALLFGDREAMLKKAHARAKALGGDASVYGDKFVKGTHVLYVLPEKTGIYDKLPVKPSVPLSVIFWKDLLKPLSLMAAGGVLAGSFLHYIIHGPKTPDEDIQTGKTEGGE